MESSQRVSQSGSVCAFDRASQRIAIAAIAVAVLLVACAKPDASKLNDPEKLWAEAERLYQDRFYEESRPFYQKIKTQFPESRHLHEAFLRVADSYYEEDEYLLAAEQYGDFVKTHPAHERVPYALYRAGVSYRKDSPKTIDRDQTGIQKAIGAFNRLVVDYPSSEYTEESAKELRDLRHRLARRLVYIGNFYFKFSNYLAALGRYTQVVQLYPDDRELAEEAYRRIVICFHRLNQPEQAAETLQVMEKEFPKSEALPVLRETLSTSGS